MNLADENENEHEHTLQDLEKYFVITQLSNENLNNIFTPIVKRFIIIQFILLLKDYLEIKQYPDIINGEKFEHFYTNNIIYNSRLNISLIQNKTIKNMMDELKKYIQTKLDTLVPTFKLDEIIVGNTIISSFKYEGIETDLNDKISKLYTILYFLLDYESYITLENFKIKIHEYMRLLVPKESNIETIKYKFIVEFLDTYNESLSILLALDTLNPLNSCKIHYVEFNDINTLNDKTHQLLSIFIFLTKPIHNPNSNETKLTISKHFFIIKDIVNHFLYEFKLKTQKMIKYSSIILHSYCSYKFKQDFFITTPKQNMTDIFIKYKELNKDIKELDNTIYFLSNFDNILYIYKKSKYNNKDRRFLSKLSINDRLFLTILITGNIDLNELYETIIKLKQTCQFSNMGSYHGDILFNVKDFKCDWFYLISEYIKIAPKTSHIPITLNTTGGFIKNINKNIKLKNINKNIKLKKLIKKSNKFIKNKKTNKVIKNKKTNKVIKNKKYNKNTKVN